MNDQTTATVSGGTGKGAPNPNDPPMWELALERYKQLDQSVRQWMIVYGVGIAALFITQSSVMKGIAKGDAYLILGLSLVPVLFQILELLLAKFTNLVTYRAEHPEEELQKTGKLYRFANCCAKPVYVGLILDLAGTISYSLATLFLIGALSTIFQNGPGRADYSCVEARNGHQEEEEEKSRQEESSSQEGGQEERPQEGGQEENEEEERKADVGADVPARGDGP